MAVQIPIVWVAESLRVTAFPIQGTPALSPDIWWENAVGHAPDTISKKPKEGLSQASGEILDGKVHMSITCVPERVDWQWRPSEKNLTIPGLPVIGDFDILLQDFLKIIESWLRNECPSLQRLAFGAVLLNEVEGKVAGYTELARLLPSITIDPEESLDFGYSINRPRPSRLHIEGLSVNRLSKWHCIAVRTLRIPQDGHPVVSQVDKNTHYCRLELDINTSSSDNLPQERLIDILNETLSLAKEITEKGDIK